MSDDKITFTILEDGTVRTEVAGISGANHASADAFVKGVDALLAGKVEIKQHAAHAHAHTHEHQHEHDKEKA